MDTICSQRGQLASFSASLKVELSLHFATKYRLSFRVSTSPAHVQQLLSEIAVHKSPANCPSIVQMKLISSITKYDKLHLTLDQLVTTF